MLKKSVGLVGSSLLLFGLAACGGGGSDSGSGSENEGSSGGSGEGGSDAEV